jgi:hypothetical protein
MENIRKGTNNGTSRQKKGIDEFEEDSYLEKLGMYADRAVDTNKYVKEEMKKLFTKSYTYNH